MWIFVCLWMCDGERERERVIEIYRMESSNPPSHPLSIQLCMFDRYRERKKEREREKGRDKCPIEVFKSSSLSLIDKVCVCVCVI